MNLSSTPTPGNEPRQLDTNHRKKILFGLTLLMLASWGYILWAKNNSRQHMMDIVHQYQSLADRKTAIRDSFHATLQRLDTLTGSTYHMEGKLASNDVEIRNLRQQILAFLSSENFTEAEKNQAAAMISRLQTIIAARESEVLQLQQDNALLAVETDSLIVERDVYRSQKDSLEKATAALAEKLRIASTLNMHSISFTPYHRTATGKQQLVRRAKKVDQLMLCFEVENRVIDEEQTDLYIIVTGPDGKEMIIPSLSTGTFDCANEGQKIFTARIPVQVKPGEKKQVAFAVSGQSFKKGEYHVSIYHHGFKIGEATQQLS